VLEQADGRIDLWGGWSLALPNPCMTTRNEDGSWSAWDSGRTIDVHIISVGGRHDGSPFTAAEMLGTEPAISGPGWMGNRQVLFEDGAHRWATTAATANTLLSCWVASRDPSDERWALQVAQSIRHDA
jgi:hypothetical protein